MNRCCSDSEAAPTERGPRGLVHRMRLVGLSCGTWTLEMKTLRAPLRRKTFTGRGTLGFSKGMTCLERLPAAFRIAFSLLAGGCTTAGRSSSGDFDFNGARASTFYTAVPARFDDGTTGFTTCAAVVLDAKKQLLVAPLQCAATELGPVACRAAFDVPLDKQLLPADFRQWAAEKFLCTVVRRIPEDNLVLLQASFPQTSTVAAAKLRKSAPLVGEEVWTVGFPEQIPSLLTRGTVATVLSKVRIDRVPAAFDAPLMGLSGAISEGSAGAGVFDRSGQLIGIVVAHARYFDGGFAILASTLRELQAH
jgi:hypothetical protein